MTYFLGMDAGGTKTTGILADEHTVLARAVAGSIIVLRISDEEAAANLAALLNDLSLQSGVRMDAIHCTCIGLAGITVPRVEQWTRNALNAQVSGKLLLCGDEEVALDGAFFGAPGVLALAGTGSNVVGRTQSGEVFHLGGWGPVLSDVGSGYWIGLQAVRAVLLATDRGIKTCLFDEILQQWKISTHADLVDVGNRVPGPDFSQLAPVVAECANAGDAVALSVLEQAGKELGEMALYALKKVQASLSVTKRPLELACTGSVLSQIPQVRAALAATVQRVLPEVALHAEPVDAALGALWRAQHG